MPDGVIVVDSSVWIALLRGHSTPQVALLRRVADRSRLVVGDLVLAEVLQGARDDLHAARIERDLRRCTVLPMVGPHLAVQAARNYRMLRAAGLTVRKTIDVLIGTFCLEHGHTLLHDDRDYDAMASVLGLAVLGKP